jgi:hypothetical protein
MIVTILHCRTQLHDTCFFIYLLPLCLTHFGSVVFIFMFTKRKSVEAKSAEQVLFLEVPKCEMFDLFDFNEFYVKKSL